MQLSSCLEGSESDAETSPKNLEASGTNEQGRATPSSIPPPAPQETASKRTEDLTSPVQSSGKTLESSSSVALSQEPKSQGSPEERRAAAAKPKTGHEQTAPDLARQHSGQSESATKSSEVSGHVEPALVHTDDSTGQLSHEASHIPPEPSAENPQNPLQSHSQTQLQPQLPQPQPELSHEGGLPSTANGAKKKPVRPKVKQLKLTLVEVKQDKGDKVVKCTLATSVGQVVNFQFSLEYDKPQEIFQKFVSGVV